MTRKRLRAIIGAHLRPADERGSSPDAEASSTLSGAFPVRSLCSVRNCSYPASGGRYCEAHADQLLSEEGL